MEKQPKQSTSKVLSDPAAAAWRLPLQVLDMTVDADAPGMLYRPPIGSAIVSGAWLSSLRTSCGGVVVLNPFGRWETLGQPNAYAMEAVRSCIQEQQWRYLCSLAQLHEKLIDALGPPGPARLLYYIGLPWEFGYDHEYAQVLARLISAFLSFRGGHALEEYGFIFDSASGNNLAVHTMTTLARISGANTIVTECWREMPEDCSCAELFRTAPQFDTSTRIRVHGYINRDTDRTLYLMHNEPDFYQSEECPKTPNIAHCFKRDAWRIMGSGGWTGRWHTSCPVNLIPQIP